MAVFVRATERVTFNGREYRAGVRLPAAASGMAGTTTTEISLAPAGGVYVGGEFFEGGQALPMTTQATMLREVYNLGESGGPDIFRSFKIAVPAGTDAEAIQREFREAIKQWLEFGTP